tara:strand:+ start:161 stop:418 length:258 start_codon:yes stop_codon:yes gene_type:complete
MKHRSIKALPEYLQPKILSAVAFINLASPNIDKAIKRIDTVKKHLSDKELKWVMSLLVFEKLLHMVEDSEEFKTFTPSMKERTVH